MRVALGRAGGRDVAVLGVVLGVTSYASTETGVAVYDVADPLDPQFLGFTRLELPDISDVVLDGDQALVASARGGTEMVNIENPDRPYSAGPHRRPVGPAGAGRERDVLLHRRSFIRTRPRAGCTWPR